MTLLKFVCNIRSCVFCQHHRTLPSWMTSLEAPTTPPQPCTTRLSCGDIGFVDPRFFEDHPSNLLDDYLPTHIQDLFEEWDEPIPISIDYLEDEIELKATIININMHPKAIDFDMDDSEFDYDIDVEFLTSTSYRKTKIYGMTANYFVPAL